MPGATEAFMDMFENSEFGQVTDEQLAAMDQAFGANHTPSSGSGSDSAAAGEPAGQNLSTKRVRTPSPVRPKTAQQQAVAERQASHQQVLQHRADKAVGKR